MKALTIGGAMIDSIAIIDDDRIERMAMRNAERAYLLIEEGRKIEAHEISQHCGGGGVNAAVSIARLGWDVSTILKLGQDARADVILRRLSDEGVSTRWVMRDPRAATGASSIIAAHERDAAIFTFRGANTLLEPDDVAAEMFAVDLVYIAGLSNEAAACFPRLVDLAKDAGARVAVNPGIRQLTLRGDELFDRLPKIDTLSVNRTEAAALVPALAKRFGEGGGPLPPIDQTEAPELAWNGLAAGGFEMSLPRLFGALAECGVGRVLLTDGAHGAFSSDGGDVHFRATETADVVGTAGAGDAFASTFAAYAESVSVATALRAASLNAGSVIGHVDTQTGLLTKAELDRRLALPDAPAASMTWPL